MLFLIKFLIYLQETNKKTANKIKEEFIEILKKKYKKELLRFIKKQEQLKSKSDKDVTF